jgi:hypothetical protein
MPPRGVAGRRLWPLAWNYCPQGWIVSAAAVVLVAATANEQFALDLERPTPADALALYLEYRASTPIADFDPSTAPLPI